MEPNALIPTGYEKIDGSLNTTALQQAAFDDIQVVGTPGSAGSYLIGKKKPASMATAPAATATPIDGSLFNSKELQDKAFSNIAVQGTPGQPGAGLVGTPRSETVTLADGRTFRIDPLTGKTTLVTDQPTAGGSTGEEVTSDELIKLAESPNTPESISSLIQGFETQNKELQKGILASMKPTEQETSLQKQIDDILAQTTKGLFNIEGRAIPLEDIGGEQERLIRNSNILLQPLTAELSRLSGGRDAQGKALTAALGFQGQNQQTQLALVQELQKPMQQAAEATQKFVLDLALKYPDAAIKITDSAASASTKAANSKSFKQSVTNGTKTQVVDTAQGTLLIDSASGNIIRNYGMNGQEEAKRDQRANALADQFVGQDVVKNFNLISTAVATVSALPKDTATSADDQALLYAFAKAMDPNSVVREGEYATIQKYSQSWLQQFGVIVDRVFNNQPLFPDTVEGNAARQNLKDTIATKYDAAKLQFENVRDAYAGQINRVTGGADGADYLIDFSQFNAKGTGPEIQRRTQQEQDATWSATVGDDKGTTIHGADGSTPHSLAEAIGEVESRGRYDARGVTVTSGAYKGDRAYGKYQIMGRNIPSWTKAALGRSLSVDQFLKDPAAQDATAIFQISRNLKRYGNADDVASVWFTGSPVSAASQTRRDDNGTTASKYVALVRAALARLS